MEVPDFKRILTCFAESPASVDISKGEFVVQLREEVISARLERKEGTLWVDDNGDRQTAESWLVRRVARLPLLADRILGDVPEVKDFVCPSGNLVPAIDRDPSGKGSYQENAVASCLTQISERTPGTTSVLYLTSDAGEGKTTVISKLARDVANNYKLKKIDWLLLPVPMGGRAFLRFDELVVSSLMQRYRFSYWFFDGFIELVRMGVVVPAFDGFEEMIVEESSGEAVSAVGNLVNQLNSEGSVLLAARKAFFEYQSFRTQARLFDAIGREDSVAFSRLSLARWSRDQFVEYGKLRNHPDAGRVFDQISEKFGNIEHPLLTRAVLVKRLFDVAVTLDEVDELLIKLGSAPRDYFHEFVLAIITREVNEKWLDREGREGVVLLSVEEHMDLLASVAREMWVSTTDVLRYDIVDVVADLYCEETKRSPAIARQVREKLKHHALLTHSTGQRSGLAFDHEDFRNFFTGVALGKLCINGAKEDIRSFLRIATIADAAADEAIVMFERAGGEYASLIARLTALASGELATSFVLENIGRLLIRALDGFVPHEVIQVNSVTFGPSSFVGRSLCRVTFHDCYFAPTSILEAHLSEIRFSECRFERIELDDKNEIDAALSMCEVACVVTVSDMTVFDPSEIFREMSECGFLIENEGVDAKRTDAPDEELVQTQRAMRIFIRSTQVNEDTLRIRLGNFAGLFFDQVIPELVRFGVLIEVPYRGGGRQRRFRLGVAMTDVQDALTKSSGKFEKFIDEFRVF